MSDELELSYRAAREVADAIERGDDVDPGDIGAAVENLLAVRERCDPAGRVAASGAREHLLARRTGADELDRHAERPLDLLDVAARRVGQIGERGAVVERLGPARHGLEDGPAWWKSLWCAGKSGVSVPSGRRYATQTCSSSNVESTSSFVNASDVIPFRRTA